MQPDLLDPGGLHTSDQDCGALIETDDGCPACLDGYDGVTDMAIPEPKGLHCDVWDGMVANRPVEDGGNGNHYHRNR